MTIDRIIAICKAYDRLGGAVQEQLDDVLQDRIEDCNPNAVDLIRKFITVVDEHAAVSGDGELQEDTQTAIDYIDEAMR